MDIEALVAFLFELRMNNHKAWFDANRPRYEVLRAAFYGELQQIIDRFARFDAPLTTLKPKDCAFRINKRFPDKEGSYKTQFSAHFTHTGRGPSMPGYYFEITAQGLINVGGGWYQPTPEHLAWIHQDIAAHSEKIERILDQPDLRRVYGVLSDQKAKKVPKDFPADHPQAELLRQKGYTVWLEADVSRIGGDLSGYVSERFQAAAPLIQYLRTMELEMPPVEPQRLD